MSSQVNGILNQQQNTLVQVRYLSMSLYFVVVVCLRGYLPNSSFFANETPHEIKNSIFVLHYYELTICINGGTA